MMWACLGAALALLASAAYAQDAAWQRSILDFATSRAALIKQGSGAEAMISDTHPVMVAQLAATSGFSVEEFETRARSGYAYAATVIRILDQTVIAERAIFGTTANFQWGIVPQSSQIEFIGEDSPKPVKCDATLIFGSAEKWYAEGLGVKGARERIVQAFPEFDALPLDAAPTCAAPTS